MCKTNDSLLDFRGQKSAVFKAFTRHFDASVIVIKIFISILADYEFIWTVMILLIGRT